MAGPSPGSLFTPRSGVVGPGVPAGDSVTAGISDTRLLCPGLGEAPREGGDWGGTGSLSAAARSNGDDVSTSALEAVELVLIGSEVEEVIVTGGLTGFEAMTVMVDSGVMS